MDAMTAVTPGADTRAHPTPAGAEPREHTVPDSTWVRTEPNPRRRYVGKHRRTSEPQRCVSCQELLPHHRPDCGGTR